MIQGIRHRAATRYRGRRRQLLVTVAAILAAIVMSVFEAGPASAQPIITSPSAICLVHAQDYCLNWTSGGPVLVNKTQQPIQDWVAVPEGNWKINGTTYNAYALCAVSNFTDCISDLNVGVGGDLSDTAPSTANGTAWVWSTDQAGFDLVSKYDLRTTGNYYDICALTPSSGVPAQLCPYGTGYWRWISIPVP
jgi:hypothetical protein